MDAAWSLMSSPSNEAMKPLLLLAIALSAAHASAYELVGKVIHVTDGDTVTLLDDAKEQYKIRLYGIDAPERKQPYGAKATDLLAGMVKGKTIRAVCANADRYGRNVCTLYDGMTDVNAEMVRQGGAWVYRKYYGKTGAYYALEDEARKAGRGLWHTSEYQAVEPWEWRKQQKEKRKKAKEAAKN